MQPLTRASLVLLLWVPSGLAGETPGQSREAQHPGLDDAYLQNLVGDWSISRRIRGTVVKNTLHAEWVLNHQFVQLHMKDVEPPPEYEALVLIGYDASTGTYVAYWCDSFGAQYASVGHGKRSGDSIDFVFAYADGPFHNTFTWIPATATWTFRMEAENQDGSRRFFAADSVRRN